MIVGVNLLFRVACSQYSLSAAACTGPNVRTRHCFLRLVAHARQTYVLSGCTKNWYFHGEAARQSQLGLIPGAGWLVASALFLRYCVRNRDRDESIGNAVVRNSVQAIGHAAIPLLLRQGHSKSNQTNSLPPMLVEWRYLLR